MLLDVLPQLTQPCLHTRESTCCHCKEIRSQLFISKQVSRCVLGIAHTLKARVSKPEDVPSIKATLAFRLVCVLWNMGPASFQRSCPFFDPVSYHSVPLAYAVLCAVLACFQTVAACGLMAS